MVVLRKLPSIKVLAGVISILALSGCTVNIQGDRFLDGGDADVRTVPAGGEQFDNELLFQLLAGEFAGNSGELEQAVKFYREAAFSSDDSRIASRATYIALYGEDYERALEVLNRWHKLAPDDSDVLKLYSVVYLKLNQPHKAAEYIKAMLAVTEEDPKRKALLVKGLLAKEADVKNGLVVLKSLVEASPDNLHMLILQARYSAQLEQYEDAINALDRVLELDPSMVNVHIIKSRILSVIGRTAEAREEVLTVLKERPEDYDLRLSYARMLVEDRLYDEAREQFLILKKQSPDNAEILLSLSLLYIDTNQLDSAVADLEHLLELGKKVDIANYYLGRIAHNKKEYKKAIAYYVKVQSPEYVFEAKLRISSLFAVLGRSDEAIEQLEFLASQQTEWPLRVRAYLAMGEILRNLGRFEEAFEMYNRVLTQNPDDADLLYARALVAEKVDRLDITEADLLKVLSNEPENVHALNALGYTLADKTERLEEAYEYIKKAAALVPDDPAILDSLGWVSYRLGKMQDALKWMGMAYEKLIDAEIAAHYGEVLWKNNQFEKAEQVWQSGIKVNANHPVLIETMKRLKSVKSEE